MLSWGAAAVYRKHRGKNGCPGEVGGQDQVFHSVADRIPDETTLLQSPFPTNHDQILHLASTMYMGPRSFASRSITPQTPTPCCHPDTFLYLYLMAKTCLRTHDKLTTAG